MNEHQRSCHMKLTITIDNDTRVYRVHPVRPMIGNCVQAVELRYADKRYQVCLTCDGGLHCSCLGYGSSKHCKHIDSLMALGILNPEPFSQTHKLYLELIEERRTLELERKQLDGERQRLREVQQFLGGRSNGSCYGVVPEQPALQAETTAKPKRPRKPRTRKPKDGEQQAA